MRVPRMDTKDRADTKQKDRVEAKQKDRVEIQQDRVKIKHPRPGQAVPLQFVASGTATGKIVRVVGRLTKGGQELVRYPFVWTPKGGKFRWQILFRVKDPGQYRLVVTGLGGDGESLGEDYVEFAAAGGY